MKRCYILMNAIVVMPNKFPVVGGHNCTAATTYKFSLSGQPYYDYNASENAMTTLSAHSLTPHNRQKCCYHLMSQEIYPQSPGNDHSWFSRMGME
jgi:hypothetical protein